MNKNCIFHIPNNIIVDGNTGSQIRPKKMLDAFSSIGYNVICISGDAKQRREKIKEVKSQMNKGLKIDFIYSESSTMPTLLTEENHIPISSFDFKFFNYCKSMGIPIGLFYRDMYWKFPIYKKGIPFWKWAPAMFFYRYDLVKYNRLIDVLYLPTVKINEVINSKCFVQPLPPGCQSIDILKKERDNTLSLVYVGGVGEIYDLSKLIKTVSNQPKINLTICCREEEWKDRRQYYSKFLSDNIHIVHKSGIELFDLYKQSDIAMLFFESSGYRSFAMPIKLFEYISHHLPIISTEKSPAGDFIKENDIGWTIPFEESSLNNLLETINTSSELLDSKKEKVRIIVEKNTWEARAKKVVSDLVK